MIRYLRLLPLLFLLYSCSTLPSAPDQNENVSVKPLPPGKDISIQIRELHFFIEVYGEKHELPERDIDDRTWLMEQINFWADRDQLTVQKIYEDLKYREWKDADKTRYLKEALLVLVENREAYLEDLAYLMNHSLLLRDTPWMVRDFYDERSEFSYWYLLYTGRSVYPFWLEEKVLPAMLSLIPQDRITSVSYLWLKNPDKLITLESEIHRAGYPWSRLIYLLEMGQYIENEIERLLPESESKMRILSGSLL